MIRLVRALVLAVVILALVGCGSAPQEAELAARAAAQGSFKAEITIGMLSQLYTDGQRDMVRDSIKIVKSEEIGSGSLTPNERNDGYTDLWCFSYSLTASGKGENFSYGMDRSYYILSFKRLNAWNGQISNSIQIAERCAH